MTATNKETSIQNKIRVALCEAGCTVHRCNTGLFYTRDGRRVTVGEVGHSDLYGHTAEGKAFYLEIKTPIGQASDDQKRFVAAMKSSGAIAGFARSIEEALKIVGG